MKRLQQTLKTYETKVVQLKQQLHEETQKRTEYEEKLASTAVVPQPMDDTSELVVNKLKQELEDAQQQCKETEERLREQEAKREESQRSLESLQKAMKNNPLSNPLVSPTDSMKSSTGEVAALKMKLKEKEQKLQNIKTQVGSVEGVLQQHKELREKLAQENKKLTQEKQSLKEHMKMQSQEVFSLKQKLHVSLS